MVLTVGPDGWGSPDTHHSLKSQHQSGKTTPGGANEDSWEPRGGDRPGSSVQCLPHLWLCWSILWKTFKREFTAVCGGEVKLKISYKCNLNFTFYLSQEIFNLESFQFWFLDFLSFYLWQIFRRKEYFLGTLQVFSSY